MYMNDCESSFPIRFLFYLIMHMTDMALSSVRLLNKSLHLWWWMVDTFGALLVVQPLY
jgi:hypothetical protein